MVFVEKAEKHLEVCPLLDLLELLLLTHLHTLQDFLFSRDHEVDLFYIFTQRGVPGSIHQGVHRDHLDHIDGFRPHICHGLLHGLLGGTVIYVNIQHMDLSVH